MSALVILECNGCQAISAPHLSAEKAREAEAPDGWLVAVDGEDLDYCPTCQAPATCSEDLVAPALADDADRRIEAGERAGANDRMKLRFAVKAIGTLGHTLRSIANARGSGYSRESIANTAAQGALYADETLRELEK
jgi:hypothetical protein